MRAEVMRQLDFPYRLEQDDVAGLQSPTATQPCDRCQKPYLIKPWAELDERERVACSYHWGKKEKQRNQGEQLRLYTCCGAGEPFFSIEKINFL